MPRFFHPLVALLASMTRSELGRQVQYLKAENQVLRAKLPKRITVTPCEQNRLLKLGKAVGPAIKHMINIVSHRTFLRWVTRPGRAGSHLIGPFRPRSTAFCDIYSLVNERHAAHHRAAVLPHFVPYAAIIPAGLPATT